MPVSLTDIIAGVTADEAKQTLANLFAASGFPVAAWQPYSVGSTLLEGEGVMMADLASLLGSIGTGGLLDYATAAWLDLLAYQSFATTRKLGIATAGTLTLTDSGAQGPIGIAAGALYARGPSGLLYRNTTGGTLTLSGTLTLAWQAEQIGSAYNASDGAAFTLATSLPGVTVTTATPPGGTWITQQGTDDESDDAIRTRCRARFPTLGAGATPAAYQYWALAASAEVTKVSVAGAYPAPGQVSIWLASASGAASGAAVSAVTAAITPPVCVQIIVAPAVVAPCAVTGAVAVKAASYDVAKSGVSQALTALFAALPMGGNIPLSSLIQTIRNVNPNIVDVVLTSPSSAGFALTASQVATLVLTMSDSGSPTTTLAFAKV